MTIIYVDPSAGSNGAGTFVSPRNIPPTAIAYGDVVLFKEGTTRSGGWTVPAPTGTPSPTNLLKIGTYSATDGAQLVNPSRMAKIVGSNTSDAIFLNGVSYVEIRGLDLKGGRDFPYSGARALGASYITVDSCRISSTVTGVGGGAYGIRFDNPTGSATSRSNWVITNNIVSDIGGNAGIFCVWGQNTGEFVTDITIRGNYVSKLNDIAGSTPNGIFIGARATTIYTDRAGLTSKGVVVEGNIVDGAGAFAYSINGVTAGGTQANRFAKNKAYNTGTGTRDMHCMWFGACQNWVIEDNLVDKSTALIGGQTGTGIGIFIDRNSQDRDGCQDMLIRRNKIFNTGKGATANLEVGGAGIMVLQSQNITVEHNLVVNCRNGIITWGGNGALDKSTNVIVRSNTILNVDSSGLYVCKIADAVTLSENVVVGGVRGLYIENSGAGAITNFTETRNRVFSVTTPWAQGNEPTQATPTISARTPAGGNTVVDVKVDALGQPMEGSPLIGAGVHVKYTRDVTGKQRDKPPTIGAYDRATFKPGT